MLQMPLVDIAMVTFNHEKYISQAIESVLNQKARFPFRLIIGDDCSDDSTYSICEDYASRFPERILLIKNYTNLGLVENYIRVFTACEAKYIAILEGDDFWTDENKIQKQVDILEANPDIAMVHSATSILVEEKGIVISPSKKAINYSRMNQGEIYETLIRGNFIYPLTVLLRRKVLLESIDFKFLAESNLKTIDYALWIGVSINAKIAYLPDVVGMYRLRNGSLSHCNTLEDQSEFFQSRRSVLNYYLSKYPVNGFTRQDIEDSINSELLTISIANEDFETAKYYAKRLSKGTMVLRIKCRIINYPILLRLYRIFRLAKRFGTNVSAYLTRASLKSTIKSLYESGRH